MQVPPRPTWGWAVHSRNGFLVRILGVPARYWVAKADRQERRTPILRAEPREMNLMNGTPNTWSVLVTVIPARGKNTSGYRKYLWNWWLRFYILTVNLTMGELGKGLKHTGSNYCCTTKLQPSELTDEYSSGKNEIKNATRNDLLLLVIGGAEHIGEHVQGVAIVLLQVMKSVACGVEGLGGEIYGEQNAKANDSLLRQCVAPRKPLRVSEVRNLRPAAVHGRSGKKLKQESGNGRAGPAPPKAQPTEGECCKMPLARLTCVRFSDGQHGAKSMQLVSQSCVSVGAFEKNGTYLTSNSKKIRRAPVRKPAILRAVCIRWPSRTSHEPGKRKRAYPLPQEAAHNNK
ncbi:hypothetical protein B0H19DRAFT_1086509 [Mycena capillaripes]|nr:hypothetical protein B0H19DRAFT_1086509 [Mycena capillaripes]